MGLVMPCDSAHQRTNEGKAAHTRNRIAVVFDKEGNPAACDNVDEPGGHCAQRTPPASHRRTNTAWARFHEASETVQLTDTQSEVAAAHAGGGELRSSLSDGVGVSVMQQMNQVEQPATQRPDNTGLCVRFKWERTDLVLSAPTTIKHRDISLKQKNSQVRTHT